MGVHKEVRKLFGTSVLNYCISARTAQGFEEASRATPEERLDVIYRWTTHKAEYQSMKQRLFETGGPDGQGTGHLTPKGFLQTRHLSFEERKKLHEARRLKREEEQQNAHGAGSGAHKHCPFCRRDKPHLHTPRAVQDTPIVLDDPDRNAEFEHAIHASVAATSHGNAEEDMMIERAIRASIKELQSTETTLTDQEALKRAIQASVVESGQNHSFNGAGSSVDFTEEDAEHQTLLEKAIEESLRSYSLPTSRPPQDIEHRR